MRHDDLINSLKHAATAFGSTFEIINLGGIYRLSRRTSLKNRPWAIIVAGFHGEEPAGPETIRAHAAEILRLAKKYNINIVLYPCANPWGYNHGKRHSPGVKATNWFTHKARDISKESLLIRRDLRKYPAHYFLDLHEDNKAAGVYIYCFVNRSLGARILKALGRHMPIEKKPAMDDPMIMNADIHDGIVWEAHDGSSEDWMSHRGAKLSVCVETPSSRYPLQKRTAAHMAAIKAFLRIAESVNYL